jgi:hypothetical protein
VPHGRRSDLINQRDLEVVEFLARYGTVPREVVARWSGCGRSVTYERERRLRAAGLIEVLHGPSPGERLLIATASGALGGTSDLDDEITAPGPRHLDRLRAHRA